MEYAEGGDLASHIQRRAERSQHFSEETILLWFVQMCLALWHVHRNGFLHRDLKAQNVFLAKDNVLKLGDFGIATLQDSTSADLRASAVGTPYMLAPGALLNTMVDCTPRALH